MDIQKEREAFEQLPAVAELIKTNDVLWSEVHGEYFGSDHELDCWIDGAWAVWQAKSQAVPEGRTDIQIIEQTIGIVRLIGESNSFECANSKVFPFESKSPRLQVWWRVACEIQELLTDTDPNNCDFEEYKAMVEAQEQSNG